MNKYYLIGAGVLLTGVGITLGFKIPEWTEQYKIGVLEDKLIGTKNTIEINSKKWKTLEDAQTALADANESNRNKEKDILSELCPMKPKYCHEILDKTMENKAPEKQRTFKYIILHHTATRTDLTLEEMKQSMLRTHGTGVAHYIVHPNGEFLKRVPLDSAVGATQNGAYNLSAVQIEMIGNFNNHNPTEAQYGTVNYLIQEIQKKKGDMEVLLHREVPNKAGEGSACPGKLFDKNRIKDLGADKTHLGKFWISRYYSPTKDQEYYYPRSHRHEVVNNKCTKVYLNNSGEKVYYKTDKKYLNGQLGDYQTDLCINTSGNPMVGAGGKFNLSEVGKNVACPPELALGTMLYVDGYGEVLCKDRGGAIKNKRLDLWVGQGQKGLDNILFNKIPGGHKDIYKITD